MPHFFTVFLFISDCQSNNFLKRHVPFKTEPIIPDFDNTGMANGFSCQVFELFQFCISWDLKNLMS